MNVRLERPLDIISGLPQDLRLGCPREFRSGLPRDDQIEFLGEVGRGRSQDVLETSICRLRGDLDLPLKVLKLQLFKIKIKRAKRALEKL